MPPADEQGPSRRTLPPGSPVELAAVSDHAYFERNPDRWERLRPAIPGEFDVGGLVVDTRGGWVRVRQFAPGVRTRELIWVS